MAQVGKNMINKGHILDPLIYKLILELQKQTMIMKYGRLSRMSLKEKKSIL